MSKKYYKVSKGSYPHTPEGGSPCVYKGESWSLYEIGDGYRLEYISGSLQGDLRSVDVSETDAVSLKSGSKTIDQVLAEYGVS